MLPREYGFGERLAFSYGVAHGVSVKSILTANIPGAKGVVAANKHEDRQGTDWWVEMLSGDRVSVDVKTRDKDWKENGQDDLALETWSVLGLQGEGKVGWTRDSDKRTDYILWVWKDTGRWCLVPFLMLCKVFQENWKSWSIEYGTHPQRTNGDCGGRGWYSECVFVPRETVWTAIYQTFGGEGVLPDPAEER